MDETKIICSINEGDEKVIAYALGGTFKLESCGFFELCNKNVEKHILSTNSTDLISASWKECVINYPRVGAVFGSVLLIIVFFIFMRRRSSLTHSVQPVL